MVQPAFFARPSDLVAPELVGKVLWREGVGGGRLTEVEAYLPENDPACHAHRGMTRRNRAMFGPPGTIYVYLSYGIHILLNLVCDREGVGSAVLIRSFEPLGDTSVLRANRANAQQPPPSGDGQGGGRRGSGDAGRGKAGTDGCWLACGPGRVGQALALTLACEGLALGAESGLYVLDDGTHPRLGQDVRVGITEGDRLPLRFYAAESEFVTNRRRTSGGSRDETA